MPGTQSLSNRCPEPRSKSASVQSGMSISIADGAGPASSTPLKERIPFPGNGDCGSQRLGSNAGHSPGRPSIWRCLDHSAGKSAIDGRLPRVICGC